MREALSLVDLAFALGMGFDAAGQPGAAEVRAMLGLADRGRIARGMKADLVAFDAASVKDTATFEKPHQYPVGIEHVLVNGEPVVENGKHNGAMPGKVLRKA